MGTRKSHVVAVAAVFLCVTLPSVCAWGFDAHELIARISQRFLSGHADAETRRILNGQPLERYATYADAFCRQAGNGWCAAMHYINTPENACEYIATRDCADGVCVANAMANYTNRLLTNASTDQFLDVSLLMHFAEDQNQPLHAGHVSDRGGNQLTGTFFGHKTNLHAIWDQGMPRHRWTTDFNGIEDYENYLVDLIEGPLSGQFKEWSECLYSVTPDQYAVCYDQWTSESARAACSVGYLDENGNRLPQPFTLGQAYYNHAVQTMETHILKGASRLAAIMNFVFS